VSPLDHHAKHRVLAALKPTRATTPHDSRVASHLVVRAARRLEIVSFTVLILVLILWGLIKFLQGTLGEEFRSLHQWVPPVTMIVGSAAMVAIARSGRCISPTLIRIGLFYEVVMSVALVCAAYLGTFRDVDPASLTIERTGLSGVAPLTLFFTVLVPARPREALIALIASTSAVPLVYLAQVRIGWAPALMVFPFLQVFVFPYIAVTVLAYVAARLVHQLGVEVREAHELGSYRLEVLLGRGGMGEVWRASHRMLARPAAIKLIRRDALASDPASAAVAVERFEREAQVTASLQSPHTVALYDFGETDDGALFYVMELLDGVTLETIVRQFGPLPPERVVHVLRQVCGSLAEAHHHGLVHRDIKPANIYLCRRAMEHDVAKVLDFGIVKKVMTADAQAVSVLTRSDAVTGTPAFMPPEIATASTVDGRADLYALGCVGYWLLTGRMVFEETTPLAVILAHVQKTPLPPSAVSELPIPEALDRLVLECLAKDPAVRPESAEALSTRLAAVPFAHPWSEMDAARWWESHQPSAPSESAYANQT
jgi:serine/threonine-protein kinase